jgi:hypothetical protein
MAGIGILVQIDPTAPVAPKAIVPLGDIALGLPLGVNILVTSLIIGRIWYISRGTSTALSMRVVKTAMAVAIESGALVVIVQIAFVTLFVAQSPAQNIAVAVAEQIYVGLSTVCSTCEYILTIFDRALRRPLSFSVLE